MGRSAESLSEAASVLEMVAEAVRATPDRTRRVRPDRALRKAAERAGTRPESAELAIATLAARLGLDPFMLEMWSEEPERTLEEVERRLREAAGSIREELQAGLHPDNMTELLSGAMDRGLVYLPPDLLRSLYALGKAAHEIMQGRRRGSEVTAPAIDLMERAAAWAASLDRRWGPGLGERLTSVRPEDPPF